METQLARAESAGLAQSGPDQRGGIAALARMSEEEFDLNLRILRSGQERIKRIHLELMTPEIDYGKIPGTVDKPTLLQPGAEKLCSFYGLVPDYQIDAQHGNGVDVPQIDITVTCALHQGTQHGPVVGVGVGNCNTWEKKYRYRRGERVCPACGLMGSLLKSKRGTPEWFCWDKRGGCGAKFALTNPEITEQVVGNIDNEDPFDLKNTILKMGKKRALIDAAKSTTGTSSLYTQDVEDMELGHGNHGSDPPPDDTGEETPGRQRAQQSARSAETQRSHGAAAGADVRKCSEPGCQASITNGQLAVSLQKFRRPLCTTHQKTQGQGEDLELQPTPPGRPPNEEHKAQRGRMFAAYEKACADAGMESNEPLMRTHCGWALSHAARETVTVTSRGALTTEQLRTCADAFEKGIPEIWDDPFAQE